MRVNKNTPAVKVVANHMHNSAAATYLGMTKLSSVQICPSAERMLVRTTLPPTAGYDGN
jgi:hypothetical protein